MNASRPASIAFHQAPEYYDRTRALPPDAMRDLTELYRAAFRGCQRVLEPGIGTGRIALPLLAAGVAVVGVDLAPAMLAQLRRNAAGGPCPPVAVADATKLPFATGGFDGAYLVHVLHLIPNWTDVVHEIIRVVRGGGTFVVDQGGRGSDDGINKAFQRAAGLERRHIGLERFEPLGDVLAGAGATLTATHPVTVRRSWTPAAHLHNLRENRYSWTWRLDDDTRRRATEAATQWARDHYGDIDASVDGEVTIELREYRLP